jgi:hypothetical protein
VNRASRFGQPCSADSLIGYLTTVSITRLYFVDPTTTNEYDAVSETIIGRGNRSIRIENCAQ